jgi:hypothetical protein
MLDHRKLITKNKLARPQSGQEPGSWSQFIRFFDKSDNPVLMIHQYLKPDGRSLGGSGKPDPKMILIDGIEYFC